MDGIWAMVIFLIHKEYKENDCGWFETQLSVLKKGDPGCLGDLLGIILVCYVRII